MPMTVTRNPNLTVPLTANDIINTVQEFFGNNWWTGLSPENCVGFNSEKEYLQALPLLNLDLCSRQDVLDYFDNTWTLTELLFQGLKTYETYTRSPYHQLRHPLLFYYGHPAVLFVNKLRLSGLLTESTDIFLEKVLETGVDEMSWDDMSKNEMIWPTVLEVHAYRKKVYSLIKNLILHHPDIEKRTNDKTSSPLWALWMGFEHEKIHFETSSVLIRELPIELVETPKFWAPLHNSSLEKFNLIPKNEIDYPQNSWLQKKASSVKIGKNKSEKSFGWDNEYGERFINIKDFQYTEKLISNGEYYQFVQSGAYTQDEFWTTEGLMWRKFRNTKRPTFWMASGPEGLHEYKLRTIFSVISMPWSWPVEVNHHEAKAYGHWRKKKDQSKLHYRLMTEAEFKSFEVINDPVLQIKNYRLNNLNSDQTPHFNFKFSSPAPVDQNLLGNVWHLLEDQFNPLEKFEAHRLYDDFSSPCFDGKHHMIMGGSFISCGHEASIWARFHFRPHFYQHSGFRLAATLDGETDNQSFKFNRSTNYIHQKRTSVLDQIKTDTEWFKDIEQPIELNSNELKNITEQTQNKILDFYKNYSNMKASGTAHDPHLNFTKINFKVPYQTTRNFPVSPQSFSDNLKLVFDDLAPLSQLPGHPAYAAYVAGSGNVFSQLAQSVALTLNPFSGHYMMAPGLVTLEAESINWFLNLFKFDPSFATGYYTTGGSQANLAALSMARKNILKSSDLSKARIYVSSQAHHCIGKALDFLGFPTDSLKKIKNDRLLKMDIEDLKNCIDQDLKAGFKPMAIVGTAGSTNTGAVDALSEISEVAKKYQIWFHVDGAYGALFMLTTAGQSLLNGIAEADTIAFDPHKALCMPYGTGALLIKDKNKIHYDYLSSTSYMPPSPDEEQTGLQIDYADMSVELSRDWRGFRVWLPIKTLGINPFILNLEEKLALTKWLQDQIFLIDQLKIFQQAQLTILSFFVTGKNQEDSNLKTQKLLEVINHNNTLFLSASSVDSQKIIRICLLGHRLHFDRLEKFVAELKEQVKALI